MLAPRRAPRVSRLVVSRISLTHLHLSPVLPTVAAASFNPLSSLRCTCSDPIAEDPEPSMLPQRQNSGKRATASHRRTRGFTARTTAFVALGLVFALYMYFNLRFFATSTASTNSIEAAGKGWRSFNGAPDKPSGAGGDTLVDASATRQVKHLVFTSTCRDLDFVHAEVLAFTLRRTGYDGNVTHLLYGCTSEQAADMKRRKDPRHRVETRHYADVSAVNTTFGEKLLTTTLNPVVLAKWMLGSDDGEFGDNRAVPFEERYALAADDFVMAVDSDAIFTKKLDMWNLMAEANDVIDPASLAKTHRGTGPSGSRSRTNSS